MLLSHGLTGFVAIKVVAKQAAPSRARAAAKNGSWPVHERVFGACANAAREG